MQRHAQIRHFPSCAVFIIYLCFVSRVYSPVITDPWLQFPNLLVSTDDDDSFALCARLVPVLYLHDDG